VNYYMQRRWSDGHMTKVKVAIANEVLRTASDHLDMKEATDLEWVSPTGFGRLHIAVRLRKHSYFERYKNEITIRCKSRYDCETELAKILQGRGDLIFYAFLNEQEDDFLKYTIGDLQVLRQWHRDCELFGGLPAKRFNKDGSGFLPVAIHELPEGFVVAVGGTEVTNFAATNDAAVYDAGMPDFSILWE
jgi:hypothetical protein